MHLALVHGLHKQENRLKVSHQDDQVDLDFPTHKESHSEGPLRSTHGAHP